MEYEVYVAKLSELPVAAEGELLVRSLTPEDRRKKYKYQKVRAVVSERRNEYPDLLWVRFLKGQRHPEPYSIKIIASTSAAGGWADGIGG